jgi:hypothetical protein
VNGSAAFLLDELLADVTGVGPGKSLAAKVKAIQAAVAAGATADACGALSAFVHEVKAQAGKKLTHAKADALLAEAAQISALLGC